MPLPIDNGGAAPKAPPPQAPAQPPVDTAAAGRDAADLHKAMKGGLTGWGTDEDAIFKTLSNKSPAQVDEIKKQYQAHYKADLVADLKSELSGNDLQRAMGLMESNQSKAAATVLKDNKDSWFGGSGEIMKTLEQATPKDRVQIAESYAQQYGQGQKGSSALTFMTDQLRGKLGSDDSKRLNSLMDAARASDNPQLAAKFQAQADTQKVKSELNSWFGSKDTVFQTLQQMSPEERAAAAKNPELVNQLTSKLDGSDRDRAMALLRGDTTSDDAARVNTMLNGFFGADTKGIRQLLDGKSPGDLQKIREAFSQQTNKDFDKTVLGQYSGAERNVVSQLLETGQAADADRLAMAMEGLGTDEQAIKDVLKGKSPDQINAIRADYQGKYKGSLDDDLKSELSGRDDFEVKQLLQGAPKTAEEKLKQLEEARDYERGWSSGAIDFVNNVTKGEADGERLDRTTKDARAYLNQAKADGVVSPEEQAKLNQMLGFAGDDVKQYQETKDSAGEAAGTAAVAVVTTAAVIGTGGAATPLAIAGYAALGAGTRMAVQGAVQGESLGSEGLFQAGVTGAVEGGTAVLPGVGKAAGAVERGAVQAGERVVEQQVVKGAEKTVAGRILEGTVQGAKQGAVGGAASGAANQAMQSETWENGVLDGGRQIAGRAVRDGAIGTVFGGAAGGTITAGAEGLKALRAKPGAPPVSSEVEGPAGNAVREGGTKAPAPPATPEARVSNAQQTLDNVAPRLEATAANEVRQAARQEGLGAVRTALGDLDSPEAAAVLEGLEGKQLKGMEQGLVAQKGDRLVYVDGQGKLADVRVTAENAKQVMAGIKAADESLGRAPGSYELRKAVVERSGNQVTTADGYTYTPPKAANGERLLGDDLKKWRADPNNWVPERRAIQQQIFSQGVDRAQALSELAEPNTIYALRGNTAAGKSTAVKSHPQFGKLAPALDGAINPDTYKFALRQADMADGLMTTASRQVHEEGSVIAGRIEAEMRKRPGSSLVFDKRFNEARDIPELLAKAKASGKTVKIVDLDAPLDLSAARVLTRTANSDAPLVPFDAVAEGFQGIRKNRGAMLFGADGKGGIVNDPLVKDYELYVVNDAGKPVRVAYKEAGVWHDPTPENQALFDRAVDTNTSPHLDLRSQVIDQPFIDRMVKTAPEPYQQGMRTALEEYRGQTLAKALDAKSKQLNDPGELYLRQAKENLQATSRTAQGTVDTSASADKAGKMAATGSEAADLANKNFDGVMKDLYANRTRQFQNPQELRAFIEQQATDINKGITKEGVLLRAGEDSAKYPYTRVKDLPKAMDQFYDELFKRLNDPRQDPKELAAWIEYRMDLTDHFFADGCGKTSKAVSAWALMRKGEPLPDYGSRDAYFDLARPKEERRIPTQVRGLDTPTSADPQFMRWYSKYMEFFPGAGAVE